LQAVPLSELMGRIEAVSNRVGPSAYAQATKIVQDKEDHEALCEWLN
jgi:hypothetical protein